MMICAKKESCNRILDQNYSFQRKYPISGAENSLATVGFGNSGETVKSGRRTIPL
jgi:hypothetical protein